MREDIRSTLDIFAALCRIPHASGHEQEIASYLLDWARSRGLSACADAAWNVVVDCPATPGLAEKPLVILQAHTDMVCVAAPGRDFDPLRDPIRLIEDGAWLRAEGTSLGADDGIGVAMILHILQGGYEHGPLRAIFTSDEEFGMTGVKALDPACFRDARWLINLDAERVDEFTTGCAGALRLELERPLTRVAPCGTQAVKISVLGGRGGHSGQEIHRGRLNALVALSFILSIAREEGIAIELADYAGGTAMNAIPGEACALIVTPSASRHALALCVSRAAALLTEAYGSAEPDIRVELEDAPLPETVLSEADCAALLALILQLPDGVSAMADGTPGLVRSSSNLGRVSLADDAARVMVMPRSMERFSLQRYRLADTSLAGSLGFSVKLERINPPWPCSAHSALAGVMRELFRELCGREPLIHACHVGLECGEFHEKAPELEIIAVGPDIFDIHSHHEALRIESVGTSLDLVTGVLRRV